MKLKMFIWSALLLQVVLFGFVWLMLRSNNATMWAGFELLTRNAPAAAPMSPDPDGLVKLINTGDWFMAAFGGFRFMAFVALVISSLSLLLLIGTLVQIRSRSPNQSNHRS